MDRNGSNDVMSSSSETAPGLMTASSSSSNITTVPLTRTQSMSLPVPPPPIASSSQPVLFSMASETSHFLIANAFKYFRRGSLFYSSEQQHSRHQENQNSLSNPQTRPLESYFIEGEIELNEDDTLRRDYELARV